MIQVIEIMGCDITASSSAVTCDHLAILYIDEGNRDHIVPGIIEVCRKSHRPIFAVQWNGANADDIKALTAASFAQYPSDPTRFMYPRYVDLDVEHKAYWSSGGKV